MIVNPIWKDTEYSVDADVLSYYITYNTEIVFRGKAYRKPDADVLSVNINKICQNYLSNELPDNFFDIYDYVNANAVGEFNLYNADNNTLLEEYRFYYDWSYDEAYDNLNNRIDGLINSHFTSGMYNLWTDKSGRGYTNHGRMASMNTGYCGDYAIYYLGSHGCWRSFLFEGYCRKTDNYTQYEYNKSFDNTTIQFEQGRYISEINTTYELTTGWLEDSQAENFAKNLVGSNMAYLHDLRNGRIFPVLVDETGVDYKTYKTNGRHLVSYTIRVRESQNRIRK